MILTESDRNIDNLDRGYYTNDHQTTLGVVGITVTAADNSRMTPELHIRLLGHFSLSAADTELAATLTARLQALLAFLLLHRDLPQSRQQLAFLFWPETTEAQAHTNLRQLLHALRHRLPQSDAYLEVTDKTVRWRGDTSFTLDVAEFEAALAEAGRREGSGRVVAFERAVAAYGGDLLPGCYDDWLLLERARLAQHFLDALEQLTLLLEQRRDYGRAIEHAERLLRHDPLHEAAYRHLMRLHAVNGDRAAALRVYHTCVTALERELDVPPGVETVEAYQRLLDLERGAALTPVPLPSGRSRFIGRQVEWQRLQDCWRTVQRGGMHCVCLSGEAGIGKTRLAEELVAWAEQQGIATAATRAYAGGGSLAYAPLVELLRAEALRPRINQLAMVWRAELARLLPELLANDPRLPQPEPLTGRGQVQRLYNAVGHALLQPRQPLILFLDDLQWFDTETITWLHYLLQPYRPPATHAGHAPRLLVLVALRHEELDEDHPAAGLLLDLLREDRITELALTPLSAAETAELATCAADRPVDAAAADTIYRTTEGNPLFIVEAVRAGLTVVTDARSVPPLLIAPKVQAVIRSRLVQLSPAASELVGLAAAIGRSFAYDVLARASGQDEDAVVHGLDELWRRRIIREEGVHSYDFSHDRIRDVAYAEVSPMQRLLFHRRIAAALEVLNGGALDAISSELAVHCERADLPSKAISFHQRAAAVARRTFANEDAIDHLSRALHLLRSLPETPARNRQELTLQIELSGALQSARSMTAPEVEAAYRRAEELARSVGEPPELFPARWGQWVFKFSVSEQRVALKIGQELLEVALKSRNTDLVLQAHHALWTSSFTTGDLSAALAHCEQGSAIYRSETHHAQLYTYGAHDAGICGLSFAAAAQWLRGYPNRALDTAQKALDLSKQLAHPASLAQSLYWSAVLYLLVRDVPAARQQAEASSRQGNQHAIPYWHGWDPCILGWADVMQGQPASGIARIQHGLDVMEARRERMFRPYFMTLLAEAYGRSGQLDRGSHTLDAAVLEAEQTGEQWWTAEMHRLQGDLLLQRRGNDGAAEQSYRQAIQIARQQQAKSLELRATMALCRLWQRLGKTVQAYQVLNESYAWFTEGFDTQDLRAAKELLLQLA